MGFLAIALFMLLVLGFLYFLRQAPGRGENGSCGFDGRDSPGPWRR